MKSVTVVGFDTSGGLPLMAVHTFSILANGNLLHEIDGKIRAEVPPEGFESYAESWEECKPVLEQRVFDVSIDALKPAIAELSKEIYSNPLDDQEQIAFLTAELAKLTAKQDNTESASPADEVTPPPPAA